MTFDPWHPSSEGELHLWNAIFLASASNIFGHDGVLRQPELVRMGLNAVGQRPYMLAGHANGRNCHVGRYNLTMKEARVSHLMEGVRAP